MMAVARRSSRGRTAEMWMSRQAVATLAGIHARPSGCPTASASRRMRARADSVMFNALNTSRPTPRPRGTVMPGARNFSGVSRKEIAATIPNHVKAAATASPPMSGHHQFKLGVGGRIVEGDDAQPGPGERLQDRRRPGRGEASQQFGEHAMMGGAHHVRVGAGGVAERAVVQQHPATGVWFGFVFLLGVLAGVFLLCFGGRGDGL